MFRLPAFAVLAVALAVAGCGESKEDKAQKAVCSARADIKKQVDELKGMTITTASLDGVQSNLRAISDNLTKIANARGDLKGEQQIQTALQGLASSYQAAFAPIDCS